MEVGEAEGEHVEAGEREDEACDEQQRDEHVHEERVLIEEHRRWRLWQAKAATLAAFQVA